MMDVYYLVLMDFFVFLIVIVKFREIYDIIEKYFRFFKVFGENVDQLYFVFFIKLKLLKVVVFRMEEYKDMEEKWIVESIRKVFKRYVCV